MTGAGRMMPIGLSLLFTILCAVIGVEVMAQRQAQQSDQAVPIIAPVRPDSPAISQPPDQRSAWFREILARPLFSPDRKPVAANARSAAGLPRLTGIVVTGTRRVAIFAGSSGGHPTVVEAGSEIGVYHVMDIADGTVTVAGPEGTTVIKPVFDPTSPAVVKAPLMARPELPKAATK